MGASELNSLAIVQSPNESYQTIAIYLNGQHLEGVRSLKLEMSAGNEPLATIVVVPELVNIEGLEVQTQIEETPLVVD